MKNKYIIAIFFSLGFFLPKVVLANEISVYFMGFGVETYTAVTKEKIIRIGEVMHPSHINSTTLLTLLNIDDGTDFYFSDRRVRAMVTDGQRNYYIDEEGVVYKNNKASTMIDKKLFTELIKND